MVDSVEGTEGVDRERAVMQHRLLFASVDLREIAEIQARGRRFVSACATAPMASLPSNTAIPHRQPGVVEKLQARRGSTSGARHGPDSWPPQARGAWQLVLAVLECQRGLATACWTSSKSAATAPRAHSDVTSSHGLATHCCIAAGRHDQGTRR